MHQQLLDISSFLLIKHTIWKLSFKCLIIFWRLTCLSLFSRAFDTFVAIHILWYLATRQWSIVWSDDRSTQHLIMVNKGFICFFNVLNYFSFLWSFKSLLINLLHFLQILGSSCFINRISSMFHHKFLKTHLLLWSCSYLPLLSFIRTLSLISFIWILSFSWSTSNLNCHWSINKLILIFIVAYVTIAIVTKSFSWSLIFNTFGSFYSNFIHLLFNAQALIRLLLIIS